jgi:hypothetical protein
MVTEPEMTVLNIVTLNRVGNTKGGIESSAGSRAKDDRNTTKEIVVASPARLPFS